MTYSEFMAGLYVKFHMTYVHSVSFVKFSQVKGNSTGFEEVIAYKADSEKVLETIENRNMVEALCLSAQGYLQWEIGELIGRSERTVRRYISEIKNKFEKECPISTT